MTGKAGKNVRAVMKISHNFKYILFIKAKILRMSTQSLLKNKEFSSLVKYWGVWKWMNFNQEVLDMEKFYKSKSIALLELFDV